MEASRHFMWNIGESPLFAAGVLVSLGFFALGLLLRVRRWGAGRKKDVVPKEPERLARVLRTVFVDNGLLGRTPRTVHRLIQYGMMVLFAGSLLVALDMHLGTHILRGDRYLAFTFLLDLAGVMVLVGLGFAAHKRYVDRPPRLETTWGNTFVLAFIALIVCTGYLVEGTRIAATLDTFARWAPVGAALGALFGSVLGVEGARSAHHLLWYFHAALALLFIALVPFSKLRHMMAVPLHVYLARPEDGRGGLPAPVQGELAGTGTPGDSTVRQLVELDACVRCGRCKKHCGMEHEGRKFAPIDLLRDLRVLVEDGPRDQPLVGSALGADALWSCTGCRACEERCPMYGEHVLRIVEMRRREVAEGREPPHVKAKLAELGLQRAGGDTLLPPERPDVYIWPGCEDRNGSRAGALSSILRLISEAGLSFAVLNPPGCCGASARRLGDEALFERLASANKEYLTALGPAPIITPCPHCMNTLANEYGRTHLDPPVVHHSQFLARLVSEKRIVHRNGPTRTVAFHDPCFLGRYNGEYEAPRRLLGAVDGLKLREMKHSRNRGACCGSGGGTVPPDAEKSGACERMNHALQAEAEVVVTACPFCRETLAAAALEEPALSRPVIMDIAEFVDHGGTNAATRS